MQYIIQLPTNKPDLRAYTINKSTHKINEFNVEQGNVVNDPTPTNLSGSPNTNFLENLKKRISAYYDIE